MADLQSLLTTTIARHFPGATVAGNRVDLGFAGLRLTCRIGIIRPLAGLSSSQLLLDLEGGGLSASVELSMTGYHETTESAIVEGACTWAESFGPVLRAAFIGDQAGTVGNVVVMRRGDLFRVYVDVFDRVLQFQPSGCEDTNAARSRLDAAPWLTMRAVTSDHYPAIPTDRPSILSVFVGEMPDRRIVEIRVDGVAYPGFDELTASAPAPPARQMVLLRELAVIVPGRESARCSEPA